MSASRDPGSFSPNFKTIENTGTRSKDGHRRRKTLAGDPPSLVMPDEN